MDAGAQSGHTSRRLARWVAVVGLGELLGFLVPATAGALWSERPWGVVAIIAAGAVEGSVLGLAQWSVMREAVHPLRVRPWVAATAIGAAVAYALGMLPSATASRWTTWPVAVQIIVAIPLFAGLLFSIGVAQWLVLRQFVAHAWWWIVGTTLGWMAGLVVFFAVAPPLWQEGQSPMTALLIGVLAGALMAAAMAIVTGLTWLRLVAAQPRRHPQPDDVAVA